MEIRLEPTTAHLRIQQSHPDGTFEARVWVGVLDDGQVVQALILNVAAPQHPDQQGLALRLAHEATKPPRKIVWVNEDTPFEGDHDAQL